MCICTLDAICCGMVGVCPPPPKMIRLKFCSLINAVPSSHPFELLPNLTSNRRKKLLPACAF